MRLQPNRVLWGQPPAYSGIGRPRRHGRRFALKEPHTWGVAEQEQLYVDQEQGSLRLRLWSGLHFKQAADHSFCVVQVEFLEHPEAKPIWLLWTGEQPKELFTLWQRYRRRFTVDHWNRLIKQRLHWTLPQLGSTQQGERWSRLIVVLSWQLWLARQGSPEKGWEGLPWQKPQAIPSPGRVAQWMAAILARIGTPAPEPKPRGKGKGWPEGKKREKKKRYPTVKKRGKTSASGGLILCHVIQFNSV